MAIRDQSILWGLSGVSIIVGAMYLVPLLDKRLGPPQTAFMALVSQAVVLQMLSITSRIERGSVRKIVVTLLWLCKACLSTVYFNASIILVARSARKEHQGKVNGVSQTAVAVARGLFPFLAGNVWASAVSSGIRGKQYLPFAMASVLMLSCAAVAFKTGRVVQQKKSLRPPPTPSTDATEGVVMKGAQCSYDTVVVVAPVSPDSNNVIDKNKELVFE